MTGHGRERRRSDRPRVRIGWQRTGIGRRRGRRRVRRRRSRRSWVRHVGTARRRRRLWRRQVHLRPLDSHRPGALETIRLHPADRLPRVAAEQARRAHAARAPRSVQARLQQHGPTVRSRWTIAAPITSHGSRAGGRFSVRWGREARGRAKARNPRSRSRRSPCAVCTRLRCIRRRPRPNQPGDRLAGTTALPTSRRQVPPAPRRRR
jgi:hypothetical protein